MLKSKNEILFENFLIEHNIKYEYQYKINVPFTQSGIHKVDFYLNDFDLYIEIKGLMTYSAVNILKYLNNYSDKNFYVLQMTEEDWINEYNKKIHKSIKNKINTNINIQFDEILKLKDNRIDINDIVNISKQRINNYIKLRNKDIDRWLKQKNDVV